MNTIIAIYAGVFLLLFMSAEVAYRFLGVKAEVTRKYVHISTGLLTLGFPFFIGSLAGVILLCAGFTVVLLVARRFGLLPAIDGVKRKTYGSVLYPLAIVLSFTAYRHFGSPVFYFVPVLILALSDPLAAWAGHRIPLGRYRIFKHRKSWGGSSAFAVSAALTTWVVLTFAGDFGVGQRALYAVVLGLITSVIEAASSKGWDNLTIPVGAIGSLALLQSIPVF